MFTIAHVTDAESAVNGTQIKPGTWKTSRIVKIGLILGAMMETAGDSLAGAITEEARMTKDTCPKCGRPLRRMRMYGQYVTDCASAPRHGCQAMASGWGKTPEEADSRFFEAVADLDRHIAMASAMDIGGGS